MFRSVALVPIATPPSDTGALRLSGEPEILVRYNFEMKGNQGHLPRSHDLILTIFRCSVAIATQSQVATPLCR